MAEPTAFSQDLCLINDLYFTQDILTKEQCLTQNEVELGILFQKKIEEAKNSFENSRLLLNGENTSIPYSECIVAAEKACLSAKNIIEALATKSLPISGQLSSALSQIEKDLESTRQLQPKGETTLQLKDIELIKKMSVIPANETYTSDQGIVYFQPKVSHTNVRPFFEGYCQSGDYKSVQTSTKATHRFFSLDLGENFQWVSLMKTKEQALYLLKQCENVTASDIQAVESRFPVGGSEKNLSTLTGLLSAGAQMLPSIKWTHQENAPKAIERSGVKEVILKQKALLTDIALHLPRVIQEEKWGFEKFQILSSEDKIKLGFKPTDAVMSDTILLFHKKVET